MQKRYALVPTILLILAACRANADLTFALTSSTLTAFPGTTVTFSGLLQNDGSTDIFINGDLNPGITATFSVDDIKFLFNAPTSLAPGDSWSGDLFDVVISSTALPGDYGGDFIILGGSGGNALDSIGAQTFVVTLPAAVTPELGAPGLLTSGTVSLLVLQWKRQMRRRKKQRQSLIN